MKPTSRIGHALRIAVLLLVCALSLQVVFVLRIALMAVVDPQSTTFQRSEAWRLLVERRQIAWSQRWVDADRISPLLARAVIASEDATFAEHGGIDWDAAEKAWGRNQRAAERAARRASERAQRFPPKIVGGSTITQQLAKNLLLSGERTIVRKAQEGFLALTLEALLSKERILEIYLNNVEWGEGLFGAEAAARFYFRTDPLRLGPAQAAHLAVMLPAPKRFERQPRSPYLVGRAQTIAARMGDVQLP